MRIKSLSKMQRIGLFARSVIINDVLSIEFISILVLTRMVACTAPEIAAW